MYKNVKDPNLVCALTGHKEGSKAFNRYRMIDEETNRQTMSYSSKGNVNKRLI